MAFVKKTWKNRISQYPNRRTINDGNVTKVVTVGRDEGTITEAGDPFSAANMNDLEQRIFDAMQGGGDGGASALSDLDDVQITSPTNGQLLKFDGTKWVNGTGTGTTPWTDVAGTLEAGNTSVTISDESITTNSTIEVFTDPEVEYNSITVVNGSATITFDEQASDLGVKVRVS